MPGWRKVPRWFDTAPVRVGAVAASVFLTIAALALFNSQTAWFPVPNPSGLQARVDLGAGFLVAAILLAAIGLAGKTAELPEESGRINASAADHPPVSRTRFRRGANRLSIAVYLAALLVYIGFGESGWVRLLWATGIVLFLAAHWPARKQEPGDGIPTWEWMIIAGITLAAYALRFAGIPNLPDNVDPDLCSFGLQALELDRTGNRSWMGVGWSEYAFVFLQVGVWIQRLFGFGVAGLMTGAVLIETLSIPALFLLGRSLFGRRVGLLAAALLAISHTHNQASRAMIMHFSTPAMIFLLYFLFHGFKERRRFDFAMVGLILALGFFGYYSFRAAPAILLLLFAWMLIWEKDRLFVLKHHWKTVLQGGLVGFGPYLIFGLQHLDAVLGRTDLVTILNADVRRHLMGVYGVETTGDLLLWQLRKSFLMFHAWGDTSQVINFPAPMLDAFTGVLLILGLGFVITRLRNMKVFGMLAWLTVIILLGATISNDPPFWPHLTVALPAVMLLAALAFESCRTQLSRALGTHGQPLSILVAAVVLVLSGFHNWNLYKQYVSSNAGPRTRIARYINQAGSGYRVQMVSHSFSWLDRDFQFINLGIPGGDVNVEDVLTGQLPQEQLPQGLSLGQTPTLFIATPDAYDALALIQERYPGGLPYKDINGQGIEVFTAYATHPSGSGLPPPPKQPDTRGLVGWTGASSAGLFALGMGLAFRRNIGLPVRGQLLSHLKRLARPESAALSGDRIAIGGEPVPEAAPQAPTDTWLSQSRLPSGGSGLSLTPNPSPEGGGEEMLPSYAGPVGERSFPSPRERGREQLSPLSPRERVAPEAPGEGLPLDFEKAMPADRPVQTRNPERKAGGWPDLRLPVDLSGLRFWVGPVIGLGLAFLAQCLFDVGRNHGLHLLPEALAAIPEGIRLGLGAALYLAAGLAWALGVPRSIPRVCHTALPVSHPDRSSQNSPSVHIYGRTISLLSGTLSHRLLWTAAFCLYAVGMVRYGMRVESTGEEPLIRWVWALSILALSLSQLPWPSRSVAARQAPHPGYGVPNTDTTASPAFQRRHWIVLAVILIAAFGLRFYRLETLPYDLHGDMASYGLTAREFVLGNQTELFNEGWANIPLLGYIPTVLSMRAFGDNLFGLNMTAVVGGMLSLIAVYLLVWRLFDRHRLAALTTALVAINTVHIHFSRLAAYMDPLPFGLFSLYFLVDGLRGRRTSSFTFAGILMGFNLLMYYSGRVTLFITAGLLLYAFLYRRLWLKNCLGGLGMYAAGVLLVFGPYLIFYSQHWGAFIQRSREVWLFNPDTMTHSMRKYGLDTQAGVLLEQVKRSLLMFHFWGDSSTQFGYPYPMFNSLLSPFIVLGLAAALRTWKQPGPALCLLWLGLTMTLGSVLTGDAPFWPRLVGIIPAAALLAALALEQVWELLRRLAISRTGKVTRQTVAAVAAAAGMVVFLIIAGWQNWSLYVNTAGVQIHPEAQIGRFLYSLPVEVTACEIIDPADPSRFSLKVREVDFLAWPRQGMDFPADTPDAGLAACPGPPFVWILSPNMVNRLPAIQQRWPGGLLETHTTPGGDPGFTSYRVPGMD